MKNKRLLIVICLSIVLVLFSYYVMSYSWAFNKQNWPMIIGLLLTFIIYMYNLIKLIKGKIKIEYIYLLLVIPLGLAFLVFQLPSFKPDEPHHIYRSYDILNSNFMPSKNAETEISEIEIPSAYLEQNGNALNNYNLINQTLFKKSDYKQLSVTYSTAAAYTPIAYIFSAIGLLIGKVFSLSPILSIYIARLFNFIISTILGFLSIKKIPFGKKILLIFLLNPMYLHQATAVTADVLLNAVAIFYVAYLLNIISKNVPVKWYNILILGTCLSTIILIKIAYFPMVLLLFMLKRKNLNINTKNVITLFLVLLIFGITYSITNSYGGYKLPSIYVQGPESVFNTGMTVLKKPLNYVYTLFNTLENKGKEYLLTFAGNYQNWYDLESKSIASILYLLVLFVSPYLFVNDKEEKNLTEILNIKNRIILFITAFIGINLIIFGMYIGFNSGVGDIVGGVQGRYFIPFVILPLLGIVSTKNQIKSKYATLIFIMLIVISNVSIIYNIINIFKPL